MRSELFRACRQVPVSSVYECSATSARAAVGTAAHTAAVLSPARGSLVTERGGRPSPLARQPAKRPVSLNQIGRAHV